MTRNVYYKLPLINFYLKSSKMFIQNLNYKIFKNTIWNFKSKSLFILVCFTFTKLICIFKSFKINTII